MIILAVIGVQTGFAPQVCALAYLMIWLTVSKHVVGVQSPTFVLSVTQLVLLSTPLPLDKPAFKQLLQTVSCVSCFKVLPAQGSNLTYGSTPTPSPPTVAAPEIFLWEGWKGAGVNCGRGQRLIGKGDFDLYYVLSEATWAKVFKKKLCTPTRQLFIFLLLMLSTQSR